MTERYLYSLVLALALTGAWAAIIHTTGLPLFVKLFLDFCVGFTMGYTMPFSGLGEEDHDTESEEARSEGDPSGEGWDG